MAVINLREKLRDGIERVHSTIENARMGVVVTCFRMNRMVANCMCTFGEQISEQPFAEREMNQYTMHWMTPEDGVTMYVIRGNDETRWSGST